MQKKTLAMMSALVLILLPTSPVWGQAVGSVTGTVADSTGAVIPLAKVTATRTATGISQRVLTSDLGTFTFSNLVVGTYSLTVDAKGFSEKSIGGVTVDVSQQRSVSFTLTPAGSAESMTVIAAAPLLNTTNGQLAGLVTQSQVVDMPLNGRSIDNLVMLQPGMAADNGEMGWLAPQWASNGNRGETEVVQLDGADASDSEMGTPEFWNFNLDAIAEFSVLQANYSAEFGQGGGSVTQIVSKSGTNQIHGSAYEFLRNNAFDATNYFATSVPPLHRNEFGAVIGGPVVKNKLFYEGEYAGLRQTLGEPTVARVPTAAERTGLVTISGYQYQVPLNSVAAQVLNDYPQPNQPNGVFGPNTLNENYSQPTNMDQFSVRMDYTISPKDSLFGRASYINNTEDTTKPIRAIENPSFSNQIFDNPRNYALSETHTFTPNLLSTAMFALNREQEGNVPYSQSIPLTIFDDGSFAQYGAQSFITKYIETYYEPSIRLALSRGRQSITTGLQYRYGQDDGFGVDAIGANGEYTFGPGTPLPQSISSTNGGPTIPAGSGSPSGAVSMMEGADVNYSQSTTIPGYGPAGKLVNWGLRVWTMGAYLQDDIRLNEKLTLNAGIRYEYQSVPYEIRDRLATIADQGPLAGDLIINPEPLYQPTRANFVPRVGFAYRVTAKTVIRGGYAIFTNLIPTVYADQAAVLFPDESTGYLSNAPYSLSPLALTLPALTATNGSVMPPNGNTTQIPPNTPVNFANIAAVTGPLTGDYASEELKNGSTMSANLTLEQQLTSGIVLTLAGVTTDSNNQFNALYPNGYVGAANAPYSTITPGLSEIQLFYSRGILRYDALQAQLRNSAPSHGLQFQLNYTWSQDLSDSDSIFSGSGNSAESLNDPSCLKCEYGPASNKVANRLEGNFDYHVPVAGIIPKPLSKGWEVTGIYNIQAGTPFTIQGPYGTQEYGYDEMNGIGARPFFIQKAPRNPNHSSSQYFSNDVITNQNNYWSVPTITSSTGLGTVQTAPGNLGRNTYYGPSWWNLDFSVVKNTTIFRESELQIRGEAFNLFNHPTFALPSGNVDAPGFGVAGGTEYNERQIQLGARVIF
jgi:hypothetical protein